MTLSSPAAWAAAYNPWTGAPTAGCWPPPPVSPPEPHAASRRPTAPATAAKNQRDRRRPSFVAADFIAVSSVAPSLRHELRSGADLHELLGPDAEVHQVTADRDRPLGDGP